MPSPRIAKSTPWRQRGVYAIEFAAVFLILFGMLYAVLCYGVLFGVRLGMQSAAEDAARVGLRYQPTVAQRLQAAETAAATRLAWMKYPPVLTAQLCAVGDTLVCTNGGAGTPTPPCSRAGNTICQIVVSISYAPYANRAQPWLPPLPNPLLPTGSAQNGGTSTFTLVGRASMLIDERSL
ncbi:MAG: pilus assembly protein [Comamonadaceae bacterium]|nr:MAG: pilus assembly protein [Comamonadaceae bacterium]